ncbi:MAG TPA: hypothetical protein VFT50_19260 [Baekduia sp.]|nr:hypothetical protein [Baekduia sp.]
MPAPRLRPSTRLAAWVWTGPIGHLYGGLLDWVELLVRLTLARARRRTRRSMG